MMGRWVSGLMLCAGLLAACGSDDKPSGGDDGDGSGGHDSAVVDDPDGGGADPDAGDPGGTRKVVRDGKNCADDDPATPGSECAGVVSCGGTAAKPEACPLDTHSCCVSGIPKDSTVNCYAGTDACQGVEISDPCDGPDDCTDGNVCCVDPPGARVTTQCRPMEECVSASGAVICHESADCPIGLDCAPLPEAPWWGSCK